VIYKYAKSGKIEARKIGGAVRITRVEFDRLKTFGLRDSVDASDNPMSLADTP